MRRWISALMVAAACVAAGGCAALSRMASPACALDPLPMRAGEAEFQILEDITFSGLLGHQRMMVVTRRDADGLQMRGLDTWGLEYFRIIQAAGGSLILEASPLMKGFDLRRMLLSFQLVHWPASILEQALAESDWTVEEKEGRRQLRCGGREWVDISYGINAGDGLNIEFVDLVAGYRLQIVQLSPGS